MSWARIDEDIYRNPKVLAVSPAARWLYIAAIAYSRDNNLGGHLDRPAQRFLVTSQGVKSACVAELIKAELFESIGAVVTIHHYEQYNPLTSTERVRRHRAKRSRNGDDAEDETPGNVSGTLPKRPSNDDGTGGNVSVTPSRARASAPDAVPVPVTGNTALLPTLSDSPPPSPPRRGAEGSAIVPLENKPPALTAIDGSLLEIPYRRFVAELNTATKRNFQGDAQSQRLFQRCLQEGRSIDDLMAAARGVALSKHHMGLNDSGIPYNAPTNVLRSKVLDQLIALGRGEIGFVREETAEERNKREIHEWAVAKEAEQAAERERKARGGGA